MRLNKVLLLQAMREYGIAEDPARLEEVFCRIIDYGSEMVPGQHFTSSMLEKKNGMERYGYADLLEALEELEIIHFGKGMVGNSCRDDAIKINPSSSLIIATDASMAGAGQKRI